jgi:plasmid stabilization system protein ParE
MALKIRWSKRAKYRYEEIIEYLSIYWTEKEIIAFIKRTDQVLNYIILNPHAYKAASGKSIRKAVIGKQNSLIYRVEGSYILLLTFWDNRQNPNKNPY